ncbi:MAG: glucosidase, partial [Planctomycetes bacterium]|nr:glucosidase [Planctomycetota bacterium]
MNAERDRLAETAANGTPWKKWGPYLSERQWGTVREDYSRSGNAWSYFPHDQARSRAYRWGEDGLGGITDDQQRLCFAVALWNGKDPILKERLFGLDNSEGNHGEDVKEYYFYLDSTPTHSYMKYLYKYPQRAYPYAQLVQVNARRSRLEMEYELLDTGAFEGDRYFDVLVEYAKASPEDILIRISATNRGPEPAELHLLPTLWFRNTWAFEEGAGRPALEEVEGARGRRTARATHPDLGALEFHVEGSATLLFTENETNQRRLFGSENPTPYVKDAFHEYVVHGRKEAVNPARKGTKAAAHHVATIAPGATETLRLRLRAGAARSAPFGRGFDDAVRERAAEAD